MPLLDKQHKRNEKAEKVIMLYLQADIVEK